MLFFLCLAFLYLLISVICWKWQSVCTNTTPKPTHICRDMNVKWVERTRFLYIHKKKRIKNLFFSFKQKRRTKTNKTTIFLCVCVKSVSKSFEHWFALNRRAARMCCVVHACVCVSWRHHNSTKSTPNKVRIAKTKKYDEYMYIKHKRESYVRCADADYSILGIVIWQNLTLDSRFRQFLLFLLRFQVETNFCREE